MKKAFAALGLGFAAASFAQPSQAADLDYQPAIHQLVVSGMVESWFGYTMYGSADVGEKSELDDHFTGGRSANLSLPLGDNLSIQMGFDNETNSEYLTSDYEDDSVGFAYSFQGTAHLNWRDPSTGLIGAFGAVGRGRYDRKTYPVHAVGGEAQLYLEDFTIYVQGGLLDSDHQIGGTDEDSLQDGGFGRGVVRWFMDDMSRLQGEFSYAAGTVGGDDDGRILEWGVRYDTMLGLPIVGDTNVFVGYRGADYENETSNEGFMDHTVMVGFRTSFGGNTMKEFDRVGASLDLPNFGRWVSSGNVLD